MDISKTWAISKSLASVLLIPLKTFVYTMGKTIKKEIMMDSGRDENQIRSKMMIDATGVAFTNRISGTKSCSMTRKRDARVAKIIPVKVAKKKPVIIRLRENKIEVQKLSVIASCASRLKTESGDAKSSSCPIYILKPCHTSNQKMIAQSLIVRFLLVDVVEFITWHLSTY